MKPLSPLLVLLMVGLGVALPGRADPHPHPTREGRLVVVIDGFEIEYSPDRDAYVQPLADALAAWHQKGLARREAATGVSLSPQDMRERRDEILHEIARAIGLDQPTPLQGPCYDTFLNYYEMVMAVQQSLVAVQEHLAFPRRLALWDRAELTDRLSRGEQVEGFTYDAASDKLDFNFAINTLGSGDASSEEQRALREVAADGLDHAFNYAIKDGVADFSATVKIQLGKLAESPAPFEASRTAERLREHLQRANLVMPVKLSNERRERLGPAEVAEQHVRFLQEFAEAAAREQPARDGVLVMLILHETAEVGLVERYIGSADRRWLCDGTANFVAWKIARDHAGPEFARQVYDVDDRLARAAEWQTRIQLARWPAVERQAEKDRKSPLDGAHYAFATRALFLMAEQHGEDIVPRLWRETGKTPRAKVSMKTVDRAFRKLTGARLGPLLRDAEKLSLPTPPPRLPATSSAGSETGHRENSAQND